MKHSWYIALSLFHSIGLFCMDKADQESTYRVVNNFIYSLQARNNTNQSIGEIRFLKNDTACLITHLHIDPSYQRQGYGSMLFKRATQLMSSQGCSEIHFDALRGSEPFYRKMGAQRNIHKPVCDGITPMTYTPHSR